MFWSRSKALTSLQSVTLEGCSSYVFKVLSLFCHPCDCRRCACALGVYWVSVVLAQVMAFPPSQESGLSH
jgi:hypothetical protein